jgi:hypothetical protein
MKNKYDWNTIDQDLLTLTNREICNKYGIADYRIVSNHRRMVMPQTTNVKRERYLDIISCTATDKEAAEILGITIGAVTHYRLRHGILKGLEHKDQTFQNWIAEQFHGKTESQINGFRVDVLTHDMIVECKVVLSKHTLYQALGQLFVYRALLGSKYKCAIAYIVKESDVTDHLLATIETAGIALLYYPEFEKGDILLENGCLNAL